MERAGVQIEPVAQVERQIVLGVTATEVVDSLGQVRQRAAEVGHHDLEPAHPVEHP